MGLKIEQDIYIIIESMGANMDDSEHIEIPEIPEIPEPVVIEPLYDSDEDIPEEVMIFYGLACKFATKEAFEAYCTILVDNGIETWAMYQNFLDFRYELEASGVPTDFLDIPEYVEP